ncbi:hypothetical protein [Bacillus sp. OK048]|uniref:hypothetical protein n=1 Tax=Bacillus sp. OK048 TaxID=1882761 RepID=UPI000880C7B5|nr:hypothetical protein [Bacillus sp. OK048]SDM16883.1 hypothetical protein SAMN05443253_102145 [Bacillus sp. OK048]
MGAINLAVAGANEGQRIKLKKGRMFIGDNQINKESVERYEIINEDSSITSYTTGNTKKSMVGAGTKGAVGAVVGSVFGPVGTLVGAAAGVTTSKAKNKSTTKEVSTKEMLVGIYFADGQESLVKMDGQYYELFLRSVFSAPIISKSKQPMDPAKKKNLLKVLGWLFIPYIMTPVFWSKLENKHRILGAAWSVLAIIIVIQGR